MPRRKKKDETVNLAVPPKEPAPEATPEPKQDRFAGRWIGEVRSEGVSWLWAPFVPLKMLTLVVGIPNVGKSTFLAALIAHALGGRDLEDSCVSRSGRVVLLGGHEESLDVMTAPRLLKAGVDLWRVKALESSDIALIRDRSRIVEVCKSVKATLVIADPIDSYMDEGLSEDNGQHVRQFLESAAWIAKHAGVAFVGARHPGKDLTNVCPGSRQWRAVPRSIVQLVSDEGFPPQYTLSHFKDSLGTNSQPLRYNLVGDPGEPKGFVIVSQLERSHDDLTKTAGNISGRWKVMQACRTIRWLFETTSEPTRVMLGEECRKQGIGEDTVNDAIRLLGVKSIPPGERGQPWMLVRTQPKWPEWIPSPESEGGAKEGSGEVANPEKS